MDVTFTARLPEQAAEVLIPGGIATPHGCSAVAMVPGLTEICEATTGQRAFRLVPAGRDISVQFRSTPSAGRYPDAMFLPRPSRFTRFADDLVAEIQPVGGKRAGLERVRAVACHVAERFSYGHAEQAFNDGFDVIPALGCGMTTGSCVDINTYFIAALRAAGIEAGYITGFFFPDEKGGSCEDGHCWVVTRCDGEIHEWDIAHHLKLGTRDIRPGLNPKPGRRVACFHSMGLDFPKLGLSGIKALIEPVALANGQIIKFDAPEIRLHAVAADPVTEDPF